MPHKFMLKGHPLKAFNSCALMLGQSWDDDYEVTPKLWEGTPMKTFPDAPWCWNIYLHLPQN